MPKSPAANPMFTKKQGRRLALVLVIALAVLLRFWRIADQSIWFDEGWSINVAQQTLPEALAQLGTEGHTHPPGYYLLLMAWMRLWGDSVLAVRSLSALLGVLSVWLTYRLGRQLVDEGTGLVAASLLAINPAHIFYSQETRMYAMLCATLTGLWMLYLRLTRDKPTARQWRFWLLLVLAEILAIYTHFFAALAIFAMVLWALPALLADRSRERWPRLACWVACQVLALLAFAPWLSTALQRASTHSTLDTAAPELANFVRETWTFLLGGHIALMGREPLFASLALASLALVVALALWLLVERERRSHAAYLAVQILATGGALFLLMQIRPGYHPRYLLMILPPLVILVAYGLVTLLRRKGLIGLVAKVAGAAAVLLWLGTQGMAAWALVTDAYYRRDDAQATISVLEDALPVDAPVLLDTDDWALKYYLADTGLDAYTVAGSVPAEDVLLQVREAVADQDQAAVVHWYQGTSDLRGIVPYVLEQQGHRTERLPMSGYTLDIYELNDASPQQVVRQDTVRFDGLEVVRVASDTEVPADDALAVALTWRAQGHLPPDLKVNLELIDPGGHEIGNRDVLLRDAQGLRSQDWASGQTVRGFYRLPLPAGAPPVTYTLQAGVYSEKLPEGLDLLDHAGAPAGKQAELLQLALSPASDIVSQTLSAESLGLAPVPGNGLVAPGLAVVGYGINGATFNTGEMVEVELAWQAKHDLPEHAVSLRLVREGHILVEETGIPVYGLHPTSAWRPGELVRAHRTLLIGPDVAAGAATLQVQIEGYDPVDLCEMTITAIARSYEMPDAQYVLDERLGTFARLIGFDLDQEEVSSALPVKLTLYWQAMGASEAPYVVFTHLLDGQGRLIAQHDGQPCQGQRPTTGWAADEYLTDEHSLTWLVSDYAGAAVVEVGLYEAATGQRVLTSDGIAQVLFAQELLVISKLETE